MHVSALTSGPPPDLASLAPAAKGADPKLAEASRNFEAILVRQFLGESMKSLVQGPSGQIYGQLLHDNLAAKITEGGGLGLASVLQAQLGSQVK